MNEDTIAGYTLFKDSYGQHSLLMRVDASREIFRQGQTSLHYLMLSVLVAGLIFAAINLLLLERLVLRRTSRLSRDVHKIGAVDDLSARLSVAGRDELAQLGFSINEMLGRLESYERERADAAAQLRQAKDEAERANRAKSEFLSRMSHELRTPLNAVLGFGQLLEMDELLPEQRQGVEQILKSGRHLLELINEVLDIARIESDRLTVALEPVEVGALMQEVLDMTRPLAAQSNIQLTMNLDGSAARHVQADRQRLKQIVLNLVSNAIKYNCANGQASLTCEEVAGDAGARLRLKVSDTGAGLSAEQQEQLFTPFARLGAEKSSIEGTGLGLAISSRLAEAMGGGLAVTTAPGKGSTFWVELPLVDAAPIARIEPEPDAALLEPGDTRALVLYVEDNLSNLTLVQRMLAHRPQFRLLSATHGQHGLELARKHRPHLILLDLQLPDIMGDEVLHLLQTDAATRTIPVVMLSADATPDQIERLLAAGATRYLTKPLDVANFRRVLDEILH